MSEIKIPLKGWLADETLQQLLALLSEGGQEARVNGGAVRNALMGLVVNDLDLSCTLEPDAVVKRLTDAGITALPTGIEHGTVTAVIDKKHYEITSLREDVSTDGRRAAVKFGTDWSKDALRRDLTMNALYCDADGTVHDPLGGYEDLKAGRVRFIGEAKDRIREDYLRILRFFRFFAWYGNFRPDADGLKAVTSEKEGLAGLSAERVWKELKLILAAQDPSRALLWMRTTGVLSKVLPESEKWGIDLIPALIAAENSHGWQPDPLVRLMAIIRPHEPQATALANRLKFSNAEALRLINWASTELPDKAISEIEFARLLYRQGGDGYCDALRLEIARAPDNGAEYRDLLAFVEGWERPVFPVKGQDLIDQGASPGPELGKRLKAMEEAWIESDFELTPDVLLLGEAE